MGTDFFISPLSALNQSRPLDKIITVDPTSADQSAQILRSREWAEGVKCIFNEKSSGFGEDPEYLYYVELALKSHSNCTDRHSGCNYIDDWGNHIGESPKITGPYS
jgi:hypothetical protein